MMVIEIYEDSLRVLEIKLMSFYREYVLEMKIVFDILKSIFEYCSGVNLRELLCISRKTLYRVLESFSWNIYLIKLSYNSKNHILCDTDRYKCYPKSYNFTGLEYRFVTRKRYEYYNTWGYLKTRVAFNRREDFYVDVYMELIEDSRVIKMFLEYGLEYFNNDLQNSEIELFEYCFGDYIEIDKN
jgi:hypothetical protein